MNVIKAEQFTEEIVDAQAATGVVYFPNVAEAIDAYVEQRKRQSAAMQAMASVMGQAFRVFLEMCNEDSAFVYEDQHVVEMAKLGAGWLDRAAARWSAQVRAKVKERDEARRADVAVRCQGEED